MTARWSSSRPIENSLMPLTLNRTADTSVCPTEPGDVRTAAKGNILGAMDIRIGIKDSAREIAFESSQKRDDVETLVGGALEGSVLKIDDAKGRRYLVPSAQIAYVEIGDEAGRKIGFVG